MRAEEQAKSPIGQQLMEYSLEKTAERLGAKWPDKAVFVVAPKRMVEDKAVYDNMLLGGRALVYLDALVDGMRQHIGASSALPVHLVGFSSGAAVVNRVLTEVLDSFREPVLAASPDGSIKPIVRLMYDKAVAANVKVQEMFFGRLVSMTWLDAANGPPLSEQHTSDEVLEAFAARAPDGWRLSARIISSEWQVNDPRRPWIRPSLAALFDLLQKLDHVDASWDAPPELVPDDDDNSDDAATEGDAVATAAADDAEIVRTLQAHFAMLDEFDL